MMQSGFGDVHSIVRIKIYLESYLVLLESFPERIVMVFGVSPEHFGISGGFLSSRVTESHL